MTVMWGVEMRASAARQLAHHCAMTVKRAAEGWRSLDTAPKDGTEIELRVVHINAAYDDEAKATASGWIATCRGHWVDTESGGGWTWHSLAGWVCQWRPISRAVEP